MNLKSFRIKNYRSIIDSNWQNLSQDNVTGLIGQNEAGKTSILEALYSFMTAEISAEVLRNDRTLPEVSCSFEISWEEIQSIFDDKLLPKGLKKIIALHNRINFIRSWTNENEEGKLLLENDVSSLFVAQNLKDAVDDKNTDEVEKDSDNDTNQETEKIISINDFTNQLFEKTPDFEFFEDDASLLPDRIDLDDLQNKNTKAEGYKGVENLLTISGLDLNFIKSGDPRLVDNYISQKSKLVTTDFREFWRQKIGKTNKIAIEFELKVHDTSIPGKVGKHYFVFWIKDGDEKLYPKQRSKGVRWFTSFYLQLKASSLNENEGGQVFLIDEPGGSLHARAQEDVLKVFEEIKNKVQVIYTTHSPYLVKLETIYRLIAVQRADELDEKSETLIFDVHKLGAASSDTLTPIYTLMGIDFSQQGTIKKNNNILIEEVSAFYYLTSFWKFTGSKKEVYFLPATGVNNIPQLANLFLGWKLNFGVLVDDDKAGRKIFNRLKRDFYLDDENQAMKKLMKIKDCSGIEDIFSNNDLKKHVLEDSTLSFTQKNSDYMKKKSKAIYALKFMLKVKNGKLKFNDLEKTSQDNITSLVNRVETLLSE